jgi:hypothetical protein
MPNFALLTGSDCVSASNCYKKEQQLIPYFKVEQMLILMQWSPWMKYDILWNHLYEDHIWWAALLLDQVWAFRGRRGGRNNNKCGLMELVNIVIPKVLIFVKVNMYRPYWVSFWWNSVGPIMHNEGRHLEKFDEGTIVLVGTDDTT